MFKRIISTIVAIAFISTQCGLGIAMSDAAKNLRPRESEGDDARAAGIKTELQHTDVSAQAGGSAVRRKVRTLEDINRDIEGIFLRLNGVYGLLAIERQTTPQNEKEKLAHKKEIRRLQLWIHDLKLRLKELRREQEQVKAAEEEILQGNVYLQVYVEKTGIGGYVKEAKGPPVMKNAGASAEASGGNFNASKQRLAHVAAGSKTGVYYPRTPSDLSPRERRRLQERQGLRESVRNARPKRYEYYDDTPETMHWFNKALISVAAFTGVLLAMNILAPSFQKTPQFDKTPSGVASEAIWGIKHGNPELFYKLQGSAGSGDMRAFGILAVMAKNGEENALTWIMGSADAERKKSLGIDDDISPTAVAASKKFIEGYDPSAIVGLIESKGDFDAVNQLLELATLGDARAAEVIKNISPDGLLEKLKTGNSDDKKEVLSFLRNLASHNNVKALTALIDLINFGNVDAVDELITFVDLNGAPESEMAVRNTQLVETAKAFLVKKSDSPDDALVYVLMTRNIKDVLSRIDCSRFIAQAGAIPFDENALEIVRVLADCKNPQAIKALGRDIPGPETKPKNKEGSGTFGAAATGKLVAVITNDPEAAQREIKESVAEGLVSNYRVEYILAEPNLPAISAAIGKVSGAAFVAVYMTNAAASGIIMNNLGHIAFDISNPEGKAAFSRALGEAV